MNIRQRKERSEGNDCRASCFHRNLVDIFNATGSFERHETSLRICTKLSHFNNWNPSIRLQYRYWTNIHQMHFLLCWWLMESHAFNHEAVITRINANVIRGDIMETSLRSMWWRTDRFRMNTNPKMCVSKKKHSTERLHVPHRRWHWWIRIWRSGYAPRWTTRA